MATTRISYPSQVETARYRLFTLRTLRENRLEIGLVSRCSWLETVLRPSIRTKVVVAIVTLVAIFSFATEARAELAARQVNQAIDDAVNYLRRQQLQNGTWPEYGGQEGGVTALCALALLSAGVPADDPAIQRALSALRPLTPQRTYAVSLKIMVFAIASPDRDRALIERHVRWLEQTQVRDGRTAGSWSYPGLSGDNSNTQFALLALYEAERVGVQANARTWLLAKNYWERSQNRDGSWGYHMVGEAIGLSNGTGSMTSAGIGSMTIIDGAVSRGNAQVEGDQILCCQEPDASRDSVQRGLDWLGRNFQVANNPGMGRHWRLYYLYGIERVGRLTARRFIGDHDWYREGAEYLLRIKGESNDHWAGLGMAEQDPRIATSLALLFIAKGRRPVLMAKLQYGRTDEWNAHPNDVNHLTQFVEPRWKMDLTWQVVALDKASVDDLLQSPVLFLCGGENPFPENEAARERLAVKLRDYLERGGFLFVDASCREDEFDQGFRQLMARVLPDPAYRLKPLEPGHPIWRAEIPLAPEQLRPIEGIDFGCRTSVVYAPPARPPVLRPSLSCLWEVSRPPRGTTYSASVQSRVDAGLAIGINVLAYATNRELKYKYEIPAHLTDVAAAQPFTRGAIYLANLSHPGGCTIAPNALVNLMKTASTELGLPMGIESRHVGPRDPALFDYHLLYMHGRNAFRFTEEEQTQLRTYLERGGMLFANSICGSKAFADSFRQAIQEMFPRATLVAIDASDPMFSRAHGGFDLSSVTLRIPQRAGAAASVEVLTRTGPPQLEGLKIDDRWAVIFSPHDIGCALEKQNSLECEGYTREDAARIGLNVLLYSLEN